MRMALFTASALVLAPCAVGLFGSAWLIGPVPAALALLVALASWKWTPETEASAEPSSSGRIPVFSYSWALGIAASAAMLLTAGSLAAFDLPHGDWDAWSIWNLRARFLAEPAMWQHAVSPLAFRSHPDYPLLWPMVVATLGHPAWIAQMIFASAAAVLFTAVAQLRGTSSGFLALLTLAASAGYLTQVPSQYADVPLSALFLVSLAMLLVHREPGFRSPALWLCGFAAGAAAFTKNEGIVFALAMTALGGWAAGRGGFMRVLGGAAPGLLITAWFKFVYAPGSEYAGQSLAKLFDPGRWAAILGQVPGELGRMGIGVGNPLLILAALALGLRFAAVSRVWLLGATVAGCQLLGYLGAYLLTPNDLVWQLNTSMNRLLGQVWPSLLLFFFTALRPPEFPAGSLGKPSSPAKPAGSRGRRHGD